MRVPRLLFPALALSAAALLAWPRTVEGFAVLGFSINTNTRDVRVFNDFPPPENLNQVPDNNFPSALGAPLAIWKGATEWASVLHNGTGAGDPTQTGLDGLGSGQANFDFLYLGEVPTAPNHNIVMGVIVPANENDRIVHRISVNTIGAGVLAITFNPDQNGWHIEFMPDQLWFDGPGNMPNGDPRFDIQGIVTHELGHALGLAHTSVLPATMFAGANPGPASVELRSLHVDDQQGIQSILPAYGSVSATKPRILAFQGILAAQQPLTVVGQNFGTGVGSNEVWFRDDAGDNQPRKVTGLSSAFSGTAITVIVPCDVVNGDVFVKKGLVTETAGQFLSNGMPLVLQSGGNGTPCMQCVGPIVPPSVPILSAVPAEIFVLAPVGAPTMACFPAPPPPCPASAQYSSVTLVDVGPFTLDPTQFIIDNDAQIRFPLPLFPTLGNFNVTLTTGGGTSCPSPVPLNVTAVTAPVLVTGPPVQSSGSTFTASLASPLGTSQVLVFSASNLPSVLPGIVSLGLGNGFTDVSFLPTPLPNAAGVSQLQFPIPPTPGGATVYFQMAAFGLSNPFGVLPIPVSTVTAVTVL